MAYLMLLSKVGKNHNPVKAKLFDVIIDKKGELKKTTDANVGDHHGMSGKSTFKGNSIQRPGGSMGGGRGLGRGRSIR